MTFQSENDTGKQSGSLTNIEPPSGNPAGPVPSGRLSPWWRRSAFLVFFIGFAILICITAKTPAYAPPIPAKVVTSTGEILFSRADIDAGQEVFLRYGLMQNGSIWGHGGYLGPDFSAEYLHTLVLDSKIILAQSLYGTVPDGLSESNSAALDYEVRQLLKKNRYDEQTGTLLFTDAEAGSFRKQIQKWAGYFKDPALNRGLLVDLINDPQEIRQLTSFFAWTAWASVANRPSRNYSYTGNFPYDPSAGNIPPADAYIWSILSIITLLAGTAIVLFVFGKFNFLGWKGTGRHLHPQFLPGYAPAVQRSLLKFFGLAALLFLAQVLVGGATAHYRAEPGNFYGLDLSAIFSQNIFRTWHIQTGLLWITICYVAGGLLLSTSFMKDNSQKHVRWINFLFAALFLVVFGSLLGEMFGIFQLMGNAWYWFGDQGWEYLDIGRGWQILLVLGMIIWMGLIFRATAHARNDPEEREIVSLFIVTTALVPLFYLPALFYFAKTHFSIVDVWRFWIVHLWVEYILELLITSMVAILFYKLGMVSRVTATRVIWLDAILFPAGGIVGTFHHMYWTGQASYTMALAATFSALEVVPLILLTLDAWDFIKLSEGTCEICGKPISVPYRWIFNFLIAVGIWNFIGAGIFGFLINMPIVSYFEAGTILTPNHAHSALMGVFGMFGVAFMILAIRQVVSDIEWAGIEKYIRISFWGLNIGLGGMVFFSLFPGGILQLWDVLQNGYWHARSTAYLDKKVSIFLEWARLPADAIFIIFGVIPLFIAVSKAYLFMHRRQSVIEQNFET